MPEAIDPVGAAVHDFLGALSPEAPPPEPEPDRRGEWLASLGEVFAGGSAAVVDDWAGVSRKLAGPGAGAHRIETAPSRARALGLLAFGVGDGWLPVLLVKGGTTPPSRASAYREAVRR